MNSMDSITISASLPVTLVPTETEIIYNSETNAYALSLGVKVQLPITELVEVLLKFNQEQVATSTASLENVHPSHDQSKSAGMHARGHSLGYLPEPTVQEASCYNLPASPPRLPGSHTTSPVHTPGRQSMGRRRSAMFPNDHFAKISLEIVKADPSLHEYRAKSKWSAPAGKFFIPARKARSETLDAQFNEGFQLFSELPVAEHFLNQEYGQTGYEYSVDEPYYYSNEHYHPRSGSMDSISSSHVEKKPFQNSKITTLSADAPVFTPGSIFTSNSSTTACDDSYRVRAMSDSENIRRDDRAMSAMAYLPPSVLSVMHEETVESDLAPIQPPGLERIESRPAECKQM